MRSFAFITSNTKSGRLSRPPYTKATQSSRCCEVASIMLHFVQILNFLSSRENLRVYKGPDDKRAKAGWSFLSPLIDKGQQQNEQKEPKKMKIGIVDQRLLSRKVGQRDPLYLVFKLMLEASFDMSLKAPFITVSHEGPRWPSGKVGAEGFQVRNPMPLKIRRVYGPAAR
ncbi:hypothetical protein AVEN_195680-1 [Araneus ventricosus]|uniref:Uncharacterized protein n=1 Tax=Araneus ventricosus TaxID=182803 RepID=A0A4Y2BC66_ARAVE|nr:hypothetical protein AVEN_195680-1 [Araneus ventricosus]